MKLLTILFAALGIFFLTSCSDVNQDMSPVSPGVEKASFDPGPISPFIYDYLQNFSEYPIVTYNSGKSDNKVTIELGGDAALSDIVHAFAIFDYDSHLLPGASKLVFLGKPTSSTVEVPGVASAQLTAVRVYYLGSSSGTPLTGAYAEFQNFTGMKMSSDLQDDHIKISSPDWNTSLLEAFVEVQSKNGNQLLFIERPSSSSFDVPFDTDRYTQGVKLFGLFE